MDQCCVHATHDDKTARAVFFADLPVGRLLDRRRDEVGIDSRTKPRRAEGVRGSGEGHWLTALRHRHAAGAEGTQCAASPPRLLSLRALRGPVYCPAPARARPPTCAPWCSPALLPRATRTRHLTHAYSCGHTHSCTFHQLHLAVMPPRADGAEAEKREPQMRASRQF
jgi:hypothetical protein